MKQRSCSKVLTPLCLATALVGCATTTVTGTTPESEASRLSGYTYIPIDPQAVEIRPGEFCSDSPSDTLVPLLDALPDNAVRMSSEAFDASGDVTFGLGKASTEVGRYRITTDYINSDTVAVPLCFERFVEGYNTETKGSSGSFLPAPMNMDRLDPKKYLIGGGEFFKVRYCPDDEAKNAERAPSGSSLESSRYWIQSYIGIGLRVTANVKVTKAGADVSGLGVLGAEAQAGKLSGELVVQTLGVNGDGVTSALPIQSELNRTTVTNAVVAVASIKALLRDTKTVKAPRLVGLYLPFRASQQLVNAIISELSSQPVRWGRPCSAPITAQQAPSDTVPPG